MSIKKRKPPVHAIHSYLSSSFRRVSCAVILLVAVFCLAVAQSGNSAETSLQQESQTKVVKVGFIDHDDSFSAIDDAGVKSGYAYEYLQFIAYYSSWRYEYVYGEFLELSEKLKNGEIDMMLHFFKDGKNEDTLLFSEYPVGTETVFLFVKPENTSIIQSKSKTLDGKTVAVMNGFYGLPFFEEWLKQNNITCTIVPYDSEKAVKEAFSNGETDFLLFSDTHSDLNWLPLYRITTADYYIAMPEKSEALHEELVHAQETMYHKNPNLNYMIYNNYYSMLYYDWHLSDDEMEWLKAHPVIAIGCLNDSMPLCGLDSTKMPSGFVVEFIERLRTTLKVFDTTIYYKFYDDDASLIRALKNHEVEVVFPVSFDLHQVEADTLYISTPILRKLSSFNADSENDSPAQPEHPYSNMVSFSSTKENVPFLDIVNRAKNYIPDEAIHTILNKYMPNEYPFSIKDFLNENFWYIVCAILLLVMVYVGFSYGNSEKKKKLSAREELAIQRDMIAHQEKLFSQLVQDFDSVSVVNLDTGEKKQFSVRGAFIGFKNDLIKFTDYRSHIEYFADKIVYADDRKDFRQAMRRDRIIEGLKEEPSYHINFRAKINDEIVYYQVKVFKDPSDEVNNTVIIGVRNVDEETKLANKQRELLEEAKNKAEVANKAKSSFLFNMSHDIRTPMNAIIGFTDIALQSKDDPERLADCLDKVQRSSAHLLKLVDDILDMARIENGKIELEETDANLITVIKDLSAIIQGTAEKKNIQFSLSLEDITDSHITIDVVRFNRIMINILSNAVKYTNSGGHVLFTVKQVSSRRNNTSTYEFIVADNGIGMTKDFVRHIYDSFSRERSSTISGVEGTGLGMSITKGLIDKMGGKISIKTQQRKGTTVTVRLPIKLRDFGTGPDSLNEETSKKEMRTSFEGFRVLLAEDNMLNREIAKTILEQKQLEVDIAEDGVVALEKIKSAEPDYYDLVFMDIQMPFMNGYTATRMIRQIKDDPRSNIPIIAMTANAFEEDKKRALEAGMNGHLAKPIKPDELLKILNDFLPAS